MILWELLQKDYISSPSHCKERWLDFSKVDTDWDWISIDKVRIKKIKVAKKLFDFQNELDDNQVTYMINNFEKEAWEPILINSDYYLLDGQHRLRLTFRTGMKYIDVVMRKRKDPDASRRILEENKNRENFERLLVSSVHKRKKQNRDICVP